MEQAETDRLARQVRQTELLISAILRGGVYLSGGVTLLGLLLFFAQNGSLSSTAATHIAFPHTIAAVISGIAHGDPVAIIVLGLVLLIATPVSRIAVSILAFAVEKDWRYVAITSAVLLILLISFFLGKAGG